MCPISELLLRMRELNVRHMFACTSRPHSLRCEASLPKHMLEHVGKVNATLILVQHSDCKVTVLNDEIRTIMVAAECGPVFTHDYQAPHDDVRFVQWLSQWEEDTGGYMDNVSLWPHCTPTRCVQQFSKLKMTTRQAVNLSIQHSKFGET